MYALIDIGPEFEPRMSLMHPDVIRRLPSSVSNRRTTSFAT